MDDENKMKDDAFKPGSSQAQVKSFADESSECEEITAQDSNDNLKSNSPEHQTAESESGESIYATRIYSFYIFPNVNNHT